MRKSSSLLFISYFALTPTGDKVVDDLVRDIGTQDVTVALIDKIRYGIAAEAGYASIAILSWCRMEA